MNEVYNNLLFSDEARKKVLVGVNTLADAVKVTMGAGGRNVLIHRQNDIPLITKDGVTVANNIHLKDTFERMGADLVRSVAMKTAKECGDGTTTATVLTQEILKRAMRDINSDVVNIIKVKHGIDFMVSKVVEMLKGISIEINSSDDIWKIANISSNGDEVISNLIKDSIEKVGRDGYVSIEKSEKMETELQFVEGLQFENGYLSPYFINNMRDYNVEYDNCNILVFDGKIANVKTIVKILEMAISEERPLLIIAESVEGQALTTMVQNKIKGIVQSVAVKSPAYGERRKDILKDICAMTGATLVTTETGELIERIDQSYFGRAKKIKVEHNGTAIIGGRSNKEELEKRISSIKSKLEKETLNEYEREKLLERYSNLTHGVAIIKVGGNSELEIQEKIDRLEDALYATKSAIDEGYVQGGGTSLFWISKELSRGLENMVELCESDSSYLTLHEPNRKIGALIVLDAIRKPAIQILENSGIEFKDYHEKLLNEKGKGMNVSNWEEGDMIDMGIIDPTKVIRMSLQNASSVASLLLTSECAISIDESEKENIQYVPIPQS